jgi:hypothetical protein
MEIFEQELRCIQNFLYLFMEDTTYLENKSLKKKNSEYYFQFRTGKKNNTINI